MDNSYHILPISQKKSFERAIRGPLVKRNRGDDAHCVYEMEGRHYSVRILYMIQDFYDEDYEDELIRAYDGAAPYLEDANREVTIIICHRRRFKKCGPYHYFISGPFYYCLEKCELAISRFRRYSEKCITVKNADELETATTEAIDYLQHYAADNIRYTITGPQKIIKGKKTIEMDNSSIEYIGNEY